MCSVFKCCIQIVQAVYFCASIAIIASVATSLACVYHAVSLLDDQVDCSNIRHIDI